MGQWDITDKNQNEKSIFINLLHESFSNKSH